MKEKNTTKFIDFFSGKDPNWGTTRAPVGLSSLVWKIKNLPVFHVVGLSQDPKVEGQSSIKSRLRRFSKSPENGFFDPEYGQNDPLRGPNFDQNFDFRGHISTFRAKNTPENQAFKVQNDA